MTDKLEQEHSPTLLERMGGASGLVYASLPTFAYVIANAIAGLNAAVVISVCVSVGLIVFRLLRKQPIQPAVSGLLGVVIAALIAYYTGSAEDYFLPGIWLSLAMAAVFSVSLLVRRPLVGVIWNLLRSAGPDRSWRADTVALRAFDIATLAFVALFSARFVVQQWLYDGGFSGWLALARIAMGYPLLGAVSVIVYWAVRRANRRIDPDIHRDSTGTDASDSPECAARP
ncbi:DUF3159 domain-containing protein [Mycobacterium sp. URHD0025]|uniref:DUF3159 domain-containing protein n=1 Tax=Mycobacterium sp. URHD0025 TaxID=1298864 RepID=UPI0004056061|nr:DUF3159 domain-containing protein [Mycobacterium sp. URHD0025]